MFGLAIEDPPSLARSFRFEIGSPAKGVNSELSKEGNRAVYFGLSINQNCILIADTSAASNGNSRAAQRLQQIIEIGSGPTGRAVAYENSQGNAMLP